MENKKRPLKQLCIYLLISYVFGMLAMTAPFRVEGGTLAILLQIFILVVFLLLLWGTSRLYFKESRAWLVTLKVFFFIGVFIAVFESFSLFYIALTNPSQTYDYITDRFFYMDASPFNGTLSMSKALGCWFFFTSMTVLPLIPLWFLYSNATRYLKEKKQP